LKSLRLSATRESVRVYFAAWLVWRPLHIPPRHVIAPARLSPGPTARERDSPSRRPSPAKILDTPPEAAFDRLTRIANQLTGTPIALVSLIDAERQWFKAKAGLGASETPRDWAFCAHAILKPHEILIVPDTAADARFRGNPLVTGAPNIRFYAGAPIITHDGHALGTVCAIDSKPRSDIGQRETAILIELAHVAADEIELRRLARQLDAEIRLSAANVTLTDDAARALAPTRDLARSCVSTSPTAGAA